LQSGTGYQIADAQSPSDASFLKDLPNLDDTGNFRFVVRPAELSPFSRSRLWRPRKPELYKQPLVLVKEAPGFLREEGWALLCFENIAFNGSFHGYSAAGASDADILAMFLHLFVHSSLWLHYALLTSSRFGVERRKMQKTDLDECPMIPLDRLTKKQRGTVAKLSSQLQREPVNANVFDDIDAFFTELYGLTKRDAEVIRDTLAVAMPYDEAREAACAPATPEQREVFRTRVDSALKPFFRKLGREVHVFAWKSSPNLSPYSVLLLGTATDPPEFPREMFEEEILPLANQAGASRIIQEVKDGLVVATLNQWRYWTPSRARLCAAEILRHHMAVFEE